MAWAQGDWPATIDDLVQQAADRDDAEPLAIAAELSGMDPAAGLLTVHAETIAGMSPSLVRNAVLSCLACSRSPPSVLVEWNTHSGESSFDALSAARARPRARNLLRPHHAPALAAARQARSLLGDGDDPLGRGWSRMVVGGILSVYGHPTEGMSRGRRPAPSWRRSRHRLRRSRDPTIEEMAAEMARQGGDRLQVLTAQQRRIAELVAEGYTSAEIGQILQLSKKTIDFHVSNIVSRLGVAHRREVRCLIEAARVP